jgi:hypothetical protein
VTLHELFTELAARMRKQQHVSECAPRLIEGCRDGLLDKDSTPAYRRTASWHEGHALGRKVRTTPIDQSGGDSE